MISKPFPLKVPLGQMDFILEGTSKIVISVPIGTNFCAFWSSNRYLQVIIIKGQNFIYGMGKNISVCSPGLSSLLIAHYRIDISSAGIIESSSLSSFFLDFQFHKSSISLTISKSAAIFVGLLHFRLKHYDGFL